MLERSSVIDTMLSPSLHKLPHSVIMVILLVLIATIAVGSATVNSATSATGDDPGNNSHNASALHVVSSPASQALYNNSISKNTYQQQNKTGQPTPAVAARPTYSRSISSSEVFSRIKLGEPITLSNVLINGDLDLSSIRKTIDTTIKITNSTINGSLNFDGVVFEDAVDISNVTVIGNTSFAVTTFSSDCKFSGNIFGGFADARFAKFNGISTFKGSIFRRFVDFSYSQFSKLVTFEDTTFQDEVNMANVQFSGDCSFEKTKFLKSADFEFSRFSQLTSFWKASFLRESSFANSQMEGTANFLNANFTGNTTFMGSRFGSEVTFSQTTFNRAAIFGLVNFDGFSDFSKARFIGVAIFAVSKFNDNARFVDVSFDNDLILENSRIYTMQLDNASFNKSSQITLKDADFTRMIAHWDAIKDHLVFDAAAYLALVKNYRNLEWRPDANDCYYIYRRLSQAEEPLGFTKLVDVIAWLSCGYGVRPSFTIYWSILLIIIFGLAYWAGNGVREFSDLIEGSKDEENEDNEANGEDKDDESDQEHHEDDEDKSSDDKGKSLLSKINVPIQTPSPHLTPTDAIYYSAMIFTSQSPANQYPVGIYRQLTVVEGLIGWFFLGLFIVVLSGTLVY